jgi:hypothetical protein
MGISWDQNISKYDTTTRTADGRILQLLRRIPGTATTRAIEHTGWRMWVHEIFGFFSISFGQPGGTMRGKLLWASDVRKAWTTAVKNAREDGEVDVRLHNPVK